MDLPFHFQKIPSLRKEIMTRHALFKSINAWAETRGYAFTTGRSTKERSGKLTITYTCDRSCHSPDISKERHRKTTIRGTGCKFSVLAKESLDKSAWNLNTVSTSSSPYTIICRVSILLHILYTAGYPLQMQTRCQLFPMRVSLLKILERSCTRIPTPWQHSKISTIKLLLQNAKSLKVKATSMPWPARWKRTAFAVEFSLPRTIGLRQYFLLIQTLYHTLKLIRTYCYWTVPIRQTSIKCLSLT